MLAECLSAVSLGVWVYLLMGRGGFWRMSVDDTPLDGGTVRRRKIAVIVPARDEAACVGRAIGSLVRQIYAGELHIWLVDDHSSDGTAESAELAAHEAGCTNRLTIVRAGNFPQGWTGKLWALSEGVRAVSSPVDYYFFTDADIVHAPEHLSSLVARAESGPYDMVSSMVKLRCESLAERILIPAFTFFFFKLYPPTWVQDSGRSTAAAAGGCILIRQEALARIGGISAIRNQLIDDCALARAVKPGGQIWLGPTSKATSEREYRNWQEIGRMISRTAFTQLQHSPALLLAAVGGMVITYLAPPLLLGFGISAASIGTAAWFLMAIAYWPTLRFYGLSRWWSLILPVVAVFYVGATAHSAIEYWRGRGGKWKGRTQDPSPVT